MSVLTERKRWQIGETEYAILDPAYIRSSRFGAFYSHPAFRDRYDANQLCRVTCDHHEVPELVAELEVLYGGLNLDFRKISGYTPHVWEYLAPALESRGWRVWTSTLMLFSAPSERTSNPAVEIRRVEPRSSDLEILYREGETLDRGFELARSQYGRVGGAYLLGYLDGRPACCTGWYAVNGMARFRHVLTAPWARGRGCATTLVHHVQTDPRVTEQDGLVILVNDEGPGGLYRDLGFREVMRFWEARRDSVQSS